MQFIKLLCLLASFFSFSQVKKLVFKQNIQNLRHINSAEDITYFSLPSGKLMLSKSFNNHQLIKASEGAHFNVQVNSINSYTLIELNRDYFLKSSFFTEKEVYISKHGSKEVKLIAQAHYSYIFDQWVACINLNKKQITFINLDNSLETTLSYESYNPYFIPKVQVINSFVYFTSQDSKGVSLVNQYGIASNRRKEIYKARSYTRKIDLTGKKDLIVGDFSLTSQKESHISSYSNNQLKPLYKSESNDLGNTKQLNDTVFFLKEVNGKSFLHSLDIKSKKIDQIKTTFEIKQFLIMDQKIIAQDQGQLWIVYDNEPQERETTL